MRVNVIGQGFEVSDAIRTYAETKTSRLSKFFDGLQLVTVRLRKLNAKTDSPFEAELILDVEKHDDFVSKASGVDPYAAIDIVAEKGERQLRTSRNGSSRATTMQARCPLNGRPAGRHPPPPTKQARCGTPRVLKLTQLVPRPAGDQTQGERRPRRSDLRIGLCAHRGGASPESSRDDLLRCIWTRPSARAPRASERVSPSRT